MECQTRKLTNRCNVVVTQCSLFVTTTTAKQQQSLLTLMLFPVHYINFHPHIIKKLIDTGKGDTKI